MTAIEDPDAVLAALERAKREAKQFREERDSLAKQLEQAGNWKTLALKAEVRSRIAEAGVKDPERIVNLVSLDGIELDDEGKAKGLDEAINNVKTSIPELFDRKMRAGGAGDIFSKDAAKAELSASQRQAQALQGA